MNKICYPINLQQGFGGGEVYTRFSFAQFSQRVRQALDTVARLTVVTQ